MGPVVVDQQVFKSFKQYEVKSFGQLKNKLEKINQ
jgi:hypothetical protein